MLNKKITMCWVNYIIVIDVSFKSRIYAFNKFSRNIKKKTQNTN